LFFSLFLWRSDGGAHTLVPGGQQTGIASLFTPKTYGGKLGGNSDTNQSNRTTTVVLDATTVYHGLKAQAHQMWAPG
jgi:hypothetical protein